MAPQHRSTGPRARVGRSGTGSFLYRWPTTDLQRTLAGLLAVLALAALVAVVAGVVAESDQVEVLQERGATTRATITGAIQRGRTTSAVISFTTSTGRSVEVSDVEVSGPVRTGRTILVTYDPLDPTAVRSSDRVTREDAVLGTAGAVVLGLLLVMQVVRAARPLRGWRRGSG